MNQLDFPVRIFERDANDYCILVPHEDISRWHNEAAKESANKTRAFCNWIRKQFPHVPTEFRFVNTKRVRIHGRRSIWATPRYRQAGCDKHFVAYGLTKAELMMIKLAWQFKSQPVRLATGPTIPDSFTVDAPGGFRPSDALKKRIEKNARAKLLSTA